MFFNYIFLILIQYNWTHFNSPWKLAVFVLQDDSPPPSLAAFCPADPSLLVYTGYGVEKELSFYSLTQKQVPQQLPHVWILSAPTKYMCYALLCVCVFLQIIKKIALPHWASCFSLASKNQLIAVGSKGTFVPCKKKVWHEFDLFFIANLSVLSCFFFCFFFTRASCEVNQVEQWEVSGLCAAQWLCADVSVLTLWVASVHCGP